MNKIYKVIWSKAKHTYVVASEIAKGHTKGETTGRGLKKLAAAMLVAAALLSPSFAWAADTVKVEPATDTASTTAVEVYTKEWAEKEISTLSTQIGTNATNNDTNTTNINGLTTRVNALESSKTDTALHISSSGDLIVGTKENQRVKDMEIRGELTSGSISTGDITSGGDVTVTGKMAADGVTDETTKDGTYIKQNNTVGNNLVSLDTQVKANADAINEEARKRKFSVTNLEKADAAEAATREAKDNELNERITNEANAIHDEIKAGDEKLDTRITNVKEYLEKQTSDTYVSKTDAAVQDGAIVKAANTIGENVTNLDAALAKETAARLGADKAQDAVIQQVNQNAANGIATLATAYNNEVASREATDNELNERITNEANAIHETTNKLQDDLNTETTAREAADTALDTRITNVKEYLEKQTSDNYVSKADAAVQDGAIVKAAKTIGENVTNLDAALAKETAARIGADKAQDEVIKQVNQNVADGFNTINTNMANGFAALNQADANEAAAREAADAELDDKITAETSARVVADTKLVEATNGGVSLDNDNVLQKTKTEISSTGEVTTSKEAATTLILNKNADNQVKIDSEGVTVGTSSTQMDAEGFTAGGHDYDKAGAALMSNGRIKGANGDFTVDENGNVTSKATITGETVTDGKGASMSNGTVTGKTLTDGIATITNGNINTSGSVTGGTVTSTGNISALGDIHAGGAITGASVSIQGALTAGSATITGDLTAGGAIQGKSISDGTATMQNGNLTGVKNLSAETITTSGDATIGGDLTVKGKLNVDEIDLTKSGIVGDNNVTASTKVAAGEITSSKTAESTKDGSIKKSAIDYDENGTSTWAQATDADGNWNKSTLTVEGNDVKSKVVDSEKNSNLSTQTSTQSQSTLTDKDKNTNVSTQTVSESSSVVSGKDGEKTYKSYITQNMKKILQGIKEGTNESIVDQTETGIKSTATDEKNTASTNLSNKGFNTYATDGTNRTYTLQTAESLTSQIGDDGKVKSVMNADGITNNADGGTITNSAKDLVNTATGDMTNTVGGTSTETVTGKKTETYNGGLETTVTGEEKHTVNGSQTNSITGDQVNTIGGKQTTTITGDVTEDYKSNLSTTVGGSQTTTVTGDSSLTAENINNTAKNKITNKALDVETEAKSSIVNKVSNDAGSNTSTQLSYETKEEMSANGKTASYLRGAAEEKSQLTDGAKKTTIDTVAGQTNTNITDGTNTSNNLQKADQAASSVTDGTNTTVVNQDAKSLASSITDGTKFNNTNNTVDKSEQLIKASDTHFYAETRTAEKAEEALKSGNTVIDIVKDTKTATVSSAVTDGTTITGISQNAKDISLSAAGGTITNDAKTLLNKASDSITDKVGENVERTMTTNKISESVKDGTKKDGTKSNSFSKTAEKDINIITDGTKTSTLSQLAGSVNTSLKEVDSSGNSVKSLNNVQTVSEDTTKITDTVTGDFSSRSQKANGFTSQVKNNSGGSNTVTDTATTSEQKLVSGNIIDILKDAENGYVNTTVSNSDGSSSTGVKQTYTDITSTAKQGTITNDAKNLVNKAEEKLYNSAAEIENTATTSIKDTVGKSTVTTTTDGTTFENTDHNVAIGDGSIKKTTISGNTLETGKATMDYAEVMKDLRVGGTTTTEDLHVTNNATIDGTLDVTGAANFQNKVTVAKDLSVGGDVTADSYKVGDKTYIDKDGINANNQVIRNVGQGDISEGSTDAVSGGQLYETNTRVSGLETRMGTVETKVDKLDGKIDKVGANAAAMANLHPLEFDEDSKWNIAAAVGSSGSETASAVGVFYRPNENVMVNASAAMGTGENMFGGGVSLRLGHGGNKAKEAQMKAAAAENKELRAKVDDLTARMDALLSVLNPNMSKDFPDVPENHWAYEAVSRLAGNGIVEGYEDGKYHGERQMTRYEMAEIIYNALSKGAKAEKKLVEEFRPELQAMAAQKKA